MNYLRQILISIALSVVLMGFGSAGYMVIECRNFMDAFYMTVIAMATVGCGEVHKISLEGRLFSVVLILLRVGFFLYVAGNIIQFLVEGRIRLVLGRRKLNTQINRLKGHYIICGYGRIGRVLARFPIGRYIDVVVIAKQLNPDLFIVARAGQNTAKKTFLAAGASKIISPNDPGARRCPTQDQCESSSYFCRRQC